MVLSRAGRPGTDGRICFIENIPEGIGHDQRRTNQTSQDDRRTQAEEVGGS
jgi:hypothetical protein